jgi:ribosome-associated protein
VSLITERGRLFGENGRMEDLVIDARLTIPGEELVETFSTSGGPGGQHANRASTRVTLAWAPANSRIDAGARSRIGSSLSSRLVGGEIRVTVDESRSQWRNRKLARRRLAAIVAEAMRPQSGVRKPTRPSRRNRQERVAEKRRRGETKRLRRPPAADD